MGNERAGLDFNSDEEIDIQELINTTSHQTHLNKEEIEKSAHDTGFVSRQPRINRAKPKSPFMIQMNIKTRVGAKEIFQEAGSILGTYDYTTFERAFISLLEKEGLNDLLKRYKDIM